MSISKSPSPHPECSHARGFLRWLVAAAVASCLSAGTAHAGPAELFSRIVVGSANSELLALPYYYGGSGLMLSSNGGMTFSLLCSSAVDPTLVREQDVYTTLLSGTGSLQLAGPTGLWTAGQNGCGWKEVVELKGTWISDLASDPVDPKRSYATTSVAGEQNGIRVNDGASAAWTAFGTPAAMQLGTLHIVKSASGKIFYARGVQSVGGMNRYVIRVSEDEANTWMEYDFGHAEAQDVRILAVDPNDPSRIVVSIVLDVDKTVLPNPPDELWFSPSRGSAGSFTKIAQVGVLKGTAFGPDSTLYYGDAASDTPGLYAVKKLGDPATKLSTSPVSCLAYDSASKRLYGCTGYEFGTFDPTTGAFQALLDKRKVSQFVDCPGEAPMAMRCQAQMTENYCGYGHYWQAPVCATYMLPGTPFDPMLAAAGSSAGVAGSGPSAGGAAVAGVGAAAGAVSMAGTGAVAPTPAPATPASSGGGCSCFTVSNPSHSRGLWALALATLAIVNRRRNRARRAQS